MLSRDGARLISVTEPISLKLIYIASVKFIKPQSDRKFYFNYKYFIERVI